MSQSATYRAVLFGPNPIAAGTEVELEYVDGALQDVIVLEAVEDTETITRTYKRGHETEEPVPYRFVEEDSTEVAGEADIPN
ncbi:hypothetical protein [Cryobacterium sp. PH29-G1]|uniref:hypothetical protein n=1 Tax=Cryobacterium sp. PH29-G1 TaxID=3046211 RepID=UPI0024BB41C0|nr:hypothetical protein [Cryobacterium sp. PH29-G1]MDJ0350984.1 hypothetical protein [Cryobacterium sp. PH29-G1]